MFQGATSLSLDAKGRMAIPARHRDALLKAAEGRLVMTAHPHRCLLLYPAPEWDPIRAQILAAPALEALSAKLKRLFVGYATDLEMDSAGRVLVSPELRNFSGLGKDIWLIGQGSHFEIWSDERWKQQQEEILALGEKLLPPGMENLAL